MAARANKAVIYHNPRCSTSRKTLDLADATDDQLLDAMAEHPTPIERPFVVTPKGTRLVDAVREIL